MVGEVDYSVLPEQQPYKIDNNRVPRMDVATKDYEIRFPVVTSDFQYITVTAEPGEYIDWHTHMPPLYQVIHCLEGAFRFRYKDNDGAEQSTEVEADEIIYIPGGAENRMEVIGDETHKHITVFPKLPVVRLEQLLGKEAGKYNPRKEGLKYGLWYDPVSDQVIEMDDDSVTATPQD